ncbi:MAG: dTDP-4-dehydrorhamnose reductase [Brevefilum sp.]|nr:dTDP-4-dehydrorhamnose reductase [Brevefilum sp.]
MKILLLGNTGQLGWELNRTLLTLGDLVALDFPQIDMADPDNIQSIVREHEPGLIVNATAYTDVEKAENQSDLAMAINGKGPGILAEEAKRLGGGLIHYSTDYIFDGKKGESYIEEDVPNPLSVYGSTKLAGEKAVQDVDGNYLIFRTSWVYSLRRPCFVTKVLKWARENEVLRIVDDQISSPTWARTLAEATGQVLAQGKKNLPDYIAENKGLYHLSDNGYCSRLEWAHKVITLDPMKHEHRVKAILPANSDDFKTQAERPFMSGMSCKKFQKQFSVITPNWERALNLAFDVN